LKSVQENSGAPKETLKVMGWIWIKVDMKSLNIF
jgi:hypothetical protein